MSAQDVLAERYGTPAPWRRRVLLLSVVAVVLAFGGWLTWATIYHAEPEAQSQLVSFEVLDDYTVDTVVDVELDTVEVPLCRLRAYAEDHSVVGEVAFEPDRADGTRQREQIRTERRATSVESLGCTTATQPRPR